jgi:hypothetical protein
MATLVPSYLEIDFTTIITRIKEQLADSDTFRDFNYEGANFTILMELMAYIGDLNVYFLNKIAKNIHIETADIYEAVNRNARQMGYEPKGPLGSRGTVTVTVTGATAGNEYRISEFTQLEAPEVTFEGDTIKFANTTLYSDTPTGSTFSIDMTVKQGEVVELTGYTGSDLIDNELLLPSNYGYDNDLDDDFPALEVTINGSEWSRVSDFYDELSPLRDDPNVYLFIYDRYERSKLVFSSSRNVPASDDTIALKVLATLGADGDIAANTITGFPAIQFVYNVTTSTWVPADQITINNNTSTTGGAGAESVDTIKENARSGLLAQFRNVADVDYESHLEQRADVTVAKAWGEQDISPSGSVVEFNRVHLSLIPTVWSDATIATSAGSWTTEWSETGATIVPSGFNRTWRSSLRTYIEPRKMISAYEVFNNPELVYFSFEFGVRKKRLANFAEISADLRNKLVYYFRAENQDFNNIISFNDIIEFLLDTTEVSPTDNFGSLKDIRNLNLRNIDVNKTVYESNVVGNYPQYVESSTTYTGENQLRKIQLGLNQFPLLHNSTVTVTEES